jgi:hypothetical protein
MYSGEKLGRTNRKLCFGCPGTLMTLTPVIRTRRQFRCIIAFEVSPILIGSRKPTINMLWTTDRTLFCRLFPHRLALSASRLSTMSYIVIVGKKQCQGVSRKQNDWPQPGFHITVRHFGELSSFLILVLNKEFITCIVYSYS